MSWIPHTREIPNHCCLEYSTPFTVMGYFCWKCYTKLVKFAFAGMKFSHSEWDQYLQATKGTTLRCCFVALFTGRQQLDNWGRRRRGGGGHANYCRHMLLPTTASGSPLPISRTLSCRKMLQKKIAKLVLHAILQVCLFVETCFISSSSYDFI